MKQKSVKPSYVIAAVIILALQIALTFLISRYDERVTRYEFSKIKGIDKEESAVIWAGMNSLGFLKDDCTVSDTLPPTVEEFETAWGHQGEEFTSFTEDIFSILMSAKPLSSIGRPPEKIHVLFGVTIPFNGINKTTIFMTWGIMAFCILLGIAAQKTLQKYPGKFQAFMELIVGFFDQICKDTLGEKRGRTFMPLFGTLFLFIVFSNWVGILPFPFIEEPTRDLNTTLGLGLLCFFIAHGYSIKSKGFGKYVADYFEPMIEVKGWKIPNIAFFPLNLVGEIGKLVSHSFRLFGNIVGGAVIILVLTWLGNKMVIGAPLPIFLNFFFGLFVGTIQAFVFSMLAIVYIGVLCEE